MRQPPASPTPVAKSGALAATEIGLRGPWLFITRAGWIVLTLLILSLSAIALTQLNTLVQLVCQPGARCLGVQITRVDLRLLHQLGLSPRFLAAYQMGLDIATILIDTALAALIFWRRSQDRMALFCAYMLVLFGGATYTGLLDYLRPLAPAWYWPVGVLELLGQLSFLIFFFLFPSGRFVPDWTRWGILVAVLLEAHYVFLTDQLQNAKDGPFDFLVFAALILGLVVLQVYRYRRVSTFRERQQTRWVIFGFSLAIVGYVLTFFLGHFFVPQEILQRSVVQILFASTVAISCFC